MGGLFIAAEIQELVAVADDALPLFFKERLQLRKVLNDDTDRDLPASHRGQQLVKLIRQGDVGELIHDEMDMDREPAPVDVIGLFAEKIEELGVAEGDQEVEGIVRIGHDQKQSCFLVTQSIQ